VRPDPRPERRPVEHRRRFAVTVTLTVDVVSHHPDPAASPVSGSSLAEEVAALLRFYAEEDYLMGDGNEDVVDDDGTEGESVLYDWTVRAVDHAAAPAVYHWN
jgi:hypothetical protein